MKSTRRSDALIGVTSIVVLLALVLVGALIYNKAFTPRVDVTLATDTIGNALQTGSDVKYHGVPVGEVTRIEPAPGGATLTLALDPSTSRILPADTTARLLPKTLFGERYVALIAPQTASGKTLQAGDVLHQDTSDQAVELEQVFDQLLPLLQSIQPAKLSASLGELATMLRGEGSNIGDSMSKWKAYLKKLDPLVPQMTDDFARLASVANTYDQAMPDLLSALDAMTVTSKTLVDQRSQLTNVFATVITSAGTTRGWVAKNQHTIEVLSDQSRDALEAVAPYASEFPCLLASARKFIPQMDHNLGKGTDEPGMHLVLNIVKSRGKYVPGKDAPRYESGKTPRCPYVTGQTGTKPASARASSTSKATTATSKAPLAIAAPPSGLVEAQLAASAGLGQANSPAENQMIAELMAPTQGIAPADYPDWGSLLVGPMLRDTKVVLK